MRKYGNIKVGLNAFFIIKWALTYWHQEMEFGGLNKSFPT